MFQIPNITFTRDYIIILNLSLGQLWKNINTNQYMMVIWFSQSMFCHCDNHMKFDQVLLGYQPGQMVERWKKQCFEDHLCTLRTRTEMVFKTLVFSPLNHLTQLIAWENFIILSCRESNKSHFTQSLLLEMTIGLLKWLQFNYPGL
jgi:hypothetical protein